MGARAGHAHRRWRISGKKFHVDHVRNDINVTPLVDVMLVLLIIFMLMTLIMGRGHDVNLPHARNYSQEKDKMQPVVTVDAAGNLWVEKENVGQVTDKDALQKMQQAVQGAWDAPKNPDVCNPYCRIYVKADDTVEFAKVYPVLMYLNKQMQVEHIDLAIAKDSEEK